MLNSMTINNILCLSIEDSFTFLAQNLLNSLQPAKKTSSLAREGKALHWEIFLSVFVVPDHKHDAYIQSRQSNPARTIKMSYWKE